MTRPLVRDGERLVETDWDTAMGRIVTRSKELLVERGPGAGHRPEPALLLLHDLRTLHLAATGNALHWLMLAQAAQATKDRRLLDLADTCRPRTLRQVDWAKTLITVMSPQALTTL